MTREIAPFIESVTQQLESEDPAMQETATMASAMFAGALLDDRGKTGDVLTVRDRLAEVYFAYLALAERVRKAVQQAEIMARRHERFADCIRGSIEAWMQTSWDAKKITGHYREFRISKNPDKVEVIDEAQIPAEFFDDVPATKVLNKTRLAEALKAKLETIEAAKKLAADLPVGKLEEIIKENTIAGAVLHTKRTRLDIK
jgi:hypothetical protein